MHRDLLRTPVVQPRDDDELKQIREWIDEAIIRTEESVEQFTDEKLLKNVRKQLEYLFAVTRNGHRPTRAEARRFALGLTARQLEEVDHRLAWLVSRLSNFLDSDSYS
jgi:hypothetical protein